jgi:hypothetical protein
MSVFKPGQFMGNSAFDVSVAVFMADFEQVM